MEGPPPQITAKSVDDYLEQLSKPVFQAGMSWRVVDAKWTGIRKGFHNFKAERAARLTGSKRPPFYDRAVIPEAHVVRPAATGLATAFYRLYLLDALAPEPARPTTLLAKIAAEQLPLASGGFSRALQALLDGGYLAPAAEGAVALTPLGAAERMAERERWRKVLPTAARLLSEEITPRPA